MTSFIISLAVRLTVLLLAGGIAVFAARQSSSAARHVMIAVTLTCVIALPVTMLLVPEWRVAVLPSPVVAPATAMVPAAMPEAAAQWPTIHPVLVTSYRETAPDRSLAPVAAPERTMSISQAALLVWLVGVLIGALWLAVGRLGLARVRRRAMPLITEDWQELLDAERARAGVAQDVTLLTSDAVSTPVTWGVIEPVIVLPEKALVWSDERRRVVLMHELAHIARRDSATQLVATLASIVYWVHPMVLVAASRLRAECERACDERVLELGTPATDYAAHLLDVARFARSFGAASIVSVAMARPSQLEGRLLAVLRASPGRTRSSGRARVLGTLFAACALVAVSAFRPVATALPWRAPELQARPRIINGEISRVPADVDRLAAREAIKRKTIVTAARRLRDSTFEKKVTVKSGGTLDLDLETGADVKIIGWDEQSVSVSGTLGGLSWKGATVSLDATGDDARLATRYEGTSDNESFDNSFTIHVPKKYNVQVESAGGSLSIDGVDGSFMGHTGGGEIRIANANGNASLTTGGGDVRISKSHLDGSVHTGGGNM
ncbi:MAG: M56 family metallopeptidase [Gemmatimonadaceae bacterium]